MCKCCDDEKACIKVDVLAASKAACQNIKLNFSNKRKTRLNIAETFVSDEKLKNVICERLKKIKYAGLYFLDSNILSLSSKSRQNIASLRKFWGAFSLETKRKCTY